MSGTGEEYTLYDEMGPFLVDGKFHYSKQSGEGAKAPNDGQEEVEVGNEVEVDGKRGKLNDDCGIGGGGNPGTSGDPHVTVCSSWHSAPLIVCVRNSSVLYSSFILSFPWLDLDVSQSSP